MYTILSKCAYQQISSTVDILKDYLYIKKMPFKDFMKNKFSKIYIYTECLNI